MAEKQVTVLPASQNKVDEETEKKYGQIDIKSIQFKDIWVFWESLKQEKGDKVTQSTNFVDNNFTIFDFNDMESLAKIWRTRVSTVSQFFTFDGKTWRHQQDKRFRSTEAICVFKKGIIPAWEDAKNSNGGDLQSMFENIDDKPEIVDNIFRDVLITILSEDYPFLSETNGIRIVDKARDKAKIRLEIWFDFCSKSEES